MKFEEFLGGVQHRIEEDSQGEAARTVRAVLETLGERVTDGEATDIAGPLPMEIDRYVLQVEHGSKYDKEEFIERVREKFNYEDLELLSRFSKPGSIERSEAVFRIKAVFDLLNDQLPGGEIDDIKQQLPEDFETFFAFTEMSDKPWDKE